ncbi:hypothetical protein A3759_06225 [Thalassolituus sp. HI0120]|jgi:outer membrane scaffolding protein for murein synthesis (MipA/OmpV family)|nr:hypothetical protein A3759_06225 [Thalassolituus sp. HI0120]
MHLFILAFVVVTAFSRPVASDESVWRTVSEPAYGLWSAGITVKASVFKDVDPAVSPALLVFGGYGDVFVEANRFGYGVYRDGTYFASIIGNFRSHTRLTEDQINESKDLSRYDLDERKAAIEVGIQAGRRLDSGWVVRAALLQDISGAHKSQETEVLFYRRDDIAGLRVLTTIGAQHQAKKFNDYYFGVDTDEIKNSTHQKVYKPGAGFSAELEVIATYNFDWGAGEEWGAYAGLRHYQYDSEAEDSPLVDDGLVQQYFIGLGKYF